MSEHKPISGADLARYWRCSPGNVTNLINRKGMPAFTSLREADEWRAVNAPIRKPPQTANSPAETSPKKGLEVGKKNARVSGSTTATASTPPHPSAAAHTPADTAPAATAPAQLPLRGVDGGADPDGVDDSDRARGRRPAGGRLYGGEPPERIDVDDFVDPDADFMELMIRQAKELPQIVYGLLKRATTKGEPGAIAAAAKNWHEASGHAADVLERYIAVRKESGALITLEAIADVVVTELEQVRKNLKKLGARHAAKANPADPALAQRIFDAAVDAALGDPAVIVERVSIEHASRHEDCDPALAPAGPAPAAAAAPAA